MGTGSVESLHNRGTAGSSQDRHCRVGQSDMTTVVKRSNIERHASAKVRITSQIVDENYAGLIIN